MVCNHARAVTRVIKHTHTHKEEHKHKKDQDSVISGS